MGVIVLNRFLIILCLAVANLGAVPAFKTLTLTVRELKKSGAAVRPGSLKRYRVKAARTSANYTKNALDRVMQLAQQVQKKPTDKKTFNQLVDLTKALRWAKPKHNAKKYKKWKAQFVNLPKLVGQVRAQAQPKKLMPKKLAWYKSIPLFKPQFVDYKPVSYPYYCRICYESRPAGEGCTLACGHTYCATCLEPLIDQAIAEHRTIGLHCPTYSCRHEISAQDIEKITHDARKIQAIANLREHERILAQPNARFCPTPDCDYVFASDLAHPHTMRCPRCAHEYCSLCLTQHADGAPCGAVRMDRASEEWLRAYTKPCPRCHTPVQKISGCDSVRCVCGHGFCWRCLGPYYHDFSHACHPTAPVVPADELR